MNQLDAIRFVCPQGHKLAISPAAAGKPGKCPRCEAKFLVPTVEEAQAVEAANRQNTIEFLCPNQHQLNAPRNMQGKRGQCPHCGAKFVIPVYETPSETSQNELESVDEIETIDDVEEVEEVEEVEVVDELEVLDDYIPEGGDEIDAAGDDDFALGEADDEEPPEAPLAEEADEDFALDGDLAEDAPPVAQTAPPAALAAPGELHFLAPVFQMQADGQHAQITLRGGQQLTVATYIASQSTAQYAVFTQGDDSGPFTIVIWETIASVAFVAGDADAG